MTGETVFSAVCHRCLGWPHCGSRYGGRPCYYPVCRKIYLETAKDVGEGLTIAFVSYIHLGMVLGRWFSKRLVRDLLEIQPDAIVLGGDIIDGNLGFVLKDGSLEELNKLRAPQGVYAVLGIQVISTLWWNTNLCI